MAKPKRYDQGRKTAPSLNAPHPLVWKSWFWLVVVQLASGLGTAHTLGAGGHTVLDRRGL